ncbi:hypothetical protein IU500_12475 [Nocardia terpenica]|uniref:hypothetical protein n=1 Tax=Nocardia terpenica TaxID=455432 RepID=UPI001896113A|nr:hypothetical protein [Nocardia terpenica]MBF6063007.1 hypothetical protein [Nocardia terpenica]MBF6104858.1 hypothetical protein [Nocardia terpenica]MBF6112705.1 hypothetical protein [Nocardia terpenica]MBF6118586.1 hypothetical protein [Nocardia terpenica]MBF6155065.1 hypothetical protein [Nocardia terpenica]
MGFSPYLLDAAAQIRTNLFGGLEQTWNSTSGTTEATFPRYQVVLQPYQSGYIDYCMIRARRNDVYDSVTGIFGKGDTAVAYALAAYTVDRTVRGGRLMLAGKTRNLIDQVTRQPTEIRAHIGNQIEVTAGEYYALACIVQNANTTGDYPIQGVASVSSLLPASVDTDFPVMYGQTSSFNVPDFPDVVEMSTLERNTRPAWLAFSKTKG